MQSFLGTVTLGDRRKILSQHEGTKDTKVSDRKIPNFVLLVSFVV